MRTLRILHVLTHDRLARGGAFQALLLAEAQKKRGHAVRVVVNGRPDQPLEPSFQEWSETRDIPLEVFRMRAGTETLRFRRFAARHRPEVIHAHRDDALRFSFFATLGMSGHVLIAQRGTTRPFRTRSVAYCHRSPRVHCTIAVAHAVRDVLVALGVPGERVEVVYGSYDAERFDPDRADRDRVRSELGIPKDGFLVVQVGALHSKKAPWDVVRAASRVRETRSDVWFALAGDGRQRKRCEALIEELGLRDRVFLLGHRRDIPDIYAAADVAVNASTGFEGLTGALREALAMERPVVATAVDGNPELIRHGETGLLVPPSDPPRLAARVLELIDDPDRARRMARAGRKLVRELMHESVRVARTEAVYRKFLERREARAGAG